MKTCLICGATAQDSCVTCPNCGEGSWSKQSETLAPVPTTSTESTRAESTSFNFRKNKR